MAFSHDNVLWSTAKPLLITSLFIIFPRVLYNKNNGYVPWRPMYIYDNILLSSSTMRNVSHEGCTENQHTHILMFNNYILKTVHLMRWRGKIMYSQTGHRLRVWSTRIACWITEATNTNSEYVILIVFHWNDGYTDATPRYVICTMPVLLYITIL